MTRKYSDPLHLISVFQNVLRQYYESILNKVLFYKHCHNLTSGLNCNACLKNLKNRKPTIPKLISIIMCNVNSTPRTSVNVNVKVVGKRVTKVRKVIPWGIL